VPTATLVRDPENGFPWGRQWDVNSGFTFIKSWMVDTDDLEACITAAGLPLPMEKFSDDYPNYKCVSLTPSPLGFQSSKVTAKYAIIGLAGWGGAGAPPPAPEPPTPEACFCEFRGVNESVTLYSAINTTNGQLLPRSYQINEGAGMPAYAGRIEVDVWSYYNPGHAPDVNYFADLHCDKAVNAESNLALPPVRGTSLIYTVGNGELLYMGFRQLITPTGQVCIVHSLWWARNHKFYWVSSKSDGSAGGASEQHIETRYRIKDFGPLWQNRP